MDRYDPLAPPDPQKWLAMGERKRIKLVQEYHRRARIHCPNREIHAVMHVIVENQIAAGDAIPVRRTADRLITEGLDRHEAIHAIAQVLTDHVFDIFSQEEAGAERPAQLNEPYYAALEKLTAAGWLLQEW
jgi:hypothetical protein